jgi:methionyl-tRNA synthetase
MSKSRGTNITARRYLELLPPEPLRYYFAAKLGNGLDDIDLNLDDFTARANADIVGKLVNIASRCAPFIDKAGGRLATALPEPALYAEFTAAAPGLATAFESREYSTAIREIMALADRANQYVDQRKPWVLIKDPAKREEALAVATQAINLFRVLMTYLAPVLPDIAAKAAAWLGAGALDHWDGVAEPLLGRALGPYPQLAARIDPATVKRLVEPPSPVPPATAAAAATGKPMITIDDFSKLDLRAAKVLAAARVEGSDKLLQLTLDLGTEQRNVFSGIRASYEPEQLVGRFVVMIANLAPRKMRFGVSEGMVLCASGDASGVFLLSADAGVAPGMKVT